ncbi:ornithine cyclodeaminase family protein [Desulfovibrio gilichinskyi]|uniref:Ornithine cyclodeaminase n=1 Tax=Desulfovibrio gilichinskyi TaxID=1519643 RepID=A0A1X7DJP3_9BACT|nr:ornithine cyclodeaminase [Desulfovibrio gilichinskyi]SMF16771.1 ornithine cyclodeaminase [Desulfovibrio gilichinskyi]
MNIPLITYDETINKLTWLGAIEALRSGHLFPKAQVNDIFLGPAEGTLLSRGAYIEGLGYGVKSTTVFAGNSKIGLPSVQGAMLVFSHEHGQLTAIIESKLITEFKTAADSVLGASLLARPDSETLLIVGAGTVARSLIKAYGAAFPNLKNIIVWARRAEKAEQLAQEFIDNDINVSFAADLPSAARKADIISTATMAREPILKYDWIKPGAHVDLIGAYKADMREADDKLISTGSLFVDSRKTTINHIGELTIPIANGTITAESIKGDLYDMINDSSLGRKSETEITIFKNGGGAHLDLMMANYIIAKA